MENNKEATAAVEEMEAKVDEEAEAAQAEVDGQAAELKLAIVDERDQIKAKLKALATAA